MSGAVHDCQNQYYGRGRSIGLSISRTKRLDRPALWRPCVRLFWLAARWTAAREKRQIAAADSEKQRVTERINTLDHDQNRIRQNIDSLNRVPGQQEQVQKYAKQLTDQEGQLATLRDHQSELERKHAALQSELNSLIEKMDF